MTGGIKDAANYIADTAKRALTSAPPTDAYLLWDSPGVEHKVPDEEKKVAEIASTMERMQKHNFDKHRHAFRATHVKTQGIVKGTLKVLDRLQPHLQQGMFSTPGKTYDVFARYANEPYLLQDDHEAGPRGLSMKVFGVTGERLEDVPEDVTTQDWFFNNAPMIELTDIDTTLDIMRLREKYFDNTTALGVALKTRTDMIKQGAPYTLPNTNIISHSMYTQSAFRFGKYYGHLGLFPVLDEQKKHAEKVEKVDPYGILGDRLFDYFRGGEAKYEFRIQLATSVLHHPTEDASIVWSEDTAPYQTIATVTFPPQDSFDHKRRIFWEDEMSLSPWRGLAAHRPLGSINRLRKGVYSHSKETRDSINVKRSHDVQSVGEMP